MTILIQVGKDISRSDFFAALAQFGPFDVIVVDDKIFVKVK